MGNNLEAVLATAKATVVEMLKSLGFKKPDPLMNLV
jgi:hypothetical protein